ncbi:MAG: S8 family serine peptidase [Oscillatoria princeps RMCB-10]|jgi:subtilisin-like proprotein convertase family protein/uncharacterized protein YcsI (UPF0317 family)|nr:S8 family serine peptidase [Oscillatoria princeps RMCB-10]
MSSFDLGNLNSFCTKTDAVGIASPDDIYQFTLSESGSFSVSLAGSSAPVTWLLKDSAGTILHMASTNATHPEIITLSDFAAGDYSLQVSRSTEDTGYTLNLDPLTGFPFESGFFTVGATGEVSFDFLLDGGNYKGEIGIFSLQGMEQFEAGSPEFIKEASGRARSNSELGYTVISDSTEGAKFSAELPWERNFNDDAEDYQDVKTFTMRPGDKFGLMLVPNGTVQDVFDNPAIDGNKRPLFSLATANPNGAFHVGQVADMTGEGSAFTMEDVRVDADTNGDGIPDTDSDYNDMVFQVKGAVGKAVLLDEVINSKRDWRKELPELVNYAKEQIEPADPNKSPESLQFTVQTPHTAGETLTVTGGKVYDSDGATDLARVDFWLRKDGGSWLDIGDAIDFAADSDGGATFNYSLTDLDAGDYQLTAVAHDKGGAFSNTVTHSFSVQEPPPPNTAPQFLQFTTEPVHTAGEPVNITGARVYDANGAGDLAKVDFWLQQDGGEWVDIGDVTSFTADASGWATFEHTLTDLGAGSYQLKAVAIDRAGAASSEVVQSFQVNPANEAPASLQFTTEPVHTAGEPVNITGAKVYDANGAGDLAKVEFSLLKDAGDWVDLEDVTSFTADGEGWATFEHSLTDLDAGSYQLKAVAIDSAGAVSEEVVQSFQVNPASQAPASLQFTTEPVHTAGEPVNITGAKVYDANGAGDLAKVDFWLQQDGGEWVDIGDVTSFTADGEGWATFEHSLTDLDAGSYRLKAVAIDSAGAVSEEVVQSFQVNPANEAPASLQFTTEPVHTAGEPVNITGAKVYDANGAGDLAKVEFSLLKDAGDWVDLEDVTSFTADGEGWATFEHSLTDLGAGSYQIKAVAIDSAGAVSEEVVQSFQVNPVNEAPAQLQFFTTQPLYTAGEPVNITGAKVYDANGVGDLAKVKFSLQKDSGEWADIGDVTSFTADASGWPTFSYSLTDLDAGSYQLKAVAIDSAGAVSDEVVQSFQVNPANEAPASLQFTTEPVHTAGEPVNITGAKVLDTNGAADLAKVDFWLQQDGGEWVDIGDVTSFTADASGWATFEYSLTDLGAGSYQLKAVAIDRAGAVSNEAVQSFQVNPANEAPAQLQFFTTQPLYTAGEPVTLTGAKVHDANGAADLAKIDFWLQQDGGEWVDIGDVTSFTADGEGWATFEHTVTDLDAGSYQLKAVAIDSAGAVSNEVVQSFQVNPANEAPASLQFTTEPVHTAGEPVRLTGAKVLDANGAADLAKVDFWLQQDGGEWVDIEDVTSFTADGEGWATFEHSLTDLDAGSYQLKAVAIDSAGAVSDEVVQSFQVNPVNEAPASLQFTTEPVHTAGEPVNITGAKVYDANGAGDLAKVEFSLLKDAGDWVDLEDVTSFTADGEGWATFEYSLTDLGAGSYQIKAVAIDRAGAVSEEVVQSFQVNPVNEAPAQLQFFTTQPLYTAGVPVSITGAKVYDANGTGDLAKVAFSLQKDGGEWVDIGHVTSFTSDIEGWAAFSYSLTDLDAGSYQLKGVATDQSGAVSNEVIQSFSVSAPLPANTPPQTLQFGTLPSYTAGETVSLTGGKVYDADGTADVSKVSFWLQKDGGDWQQRTDVKQFTAGGEGWADFSYELTGLEAGSYQLKAIAYDGTNAASNAVIQSFSVVSEPVVVEPPPNTPPQLLQFSTQPVYSVYETASLTGAKVYDPDGASDLSRVDFWLKSDSGDWTDISDVTSFAAEGEGWGTFSYSLPFLGVGSYELKAVAYDWAGAASNTVTQSFWVYDPIEPYYNTSPESLQFRTLPLYTTAETLSFSGAKVYDPDGTSDLSKVDFWLRKPTGEWVDINDVTEFSTDSKGRARFSFKYDLKGLAPGNYQLWAEAYDQGGAASNTATQNFTVISDPGGSGLSDEVRLAIAQAANLENYDPEALAQTREWVVWVTPGQSSQELATRLGAVDLGATGHIPNTYIWGLPESVAPEVMAEQLGSLSGVEFAYPLVPFQPELLSEPNDPRFPDQWHLRSGVNPSADANITAAWNLPVPGKPSQTVRGRGVVIGIVDDGLDYTHLDLKGRYLNNLSWDFNEGDSNPSPTYNDILLAKNLPKKIKDFTWGQDFSIDVPLTGVVSDVNVRLDITHPYVNDLEGFLVSPDEPIFNPLIVQGAQSSRRIKGGTDGDEDPVELFSDVGGSGDNFTNTKFDDGALPLIINGIAPFYGSFKPEGHLADFNDQWVGGVWKLRINDTLKGKQKGKPSSLDNWGLELETYNPHGTSVAGVAAASGNNGIGGSGVAPEASLAGLRLVADEVTDTQIAGALFYRNSDIDIYNNSWKLEEPLVSLPLSLRAMGAGSTKGRNNLGNIYVFGAGNDGWIGGNVNYNGFANSRYAIAVGAIDGTGKQSWYSEPGASLLVSAYASSGGVGITTTDIAGSRGYDQGDNTSRFGGTSAASAMVSGVIALMLEANPNLTWRDVQHILVGTAKQNDAPTLTHDKGWTTNGAGYHINYKYGFGAVDGEAAVKAARNWTPVGKELKVSSNLESVTENIPDGDETGVSSTVSINDNITVEKVEVVFDAKHKDWGDLKVVLKSPDGTESVLAQPIYDESSLSNSKKQAPEGSYWTFTSVRHWGESSKGDWTLEVLDEDGNQVEGIWNSWKLNIYGTEPAVTVSATDANASESGDPGAFIFRRTGSLKEELTVNYSVAGDATNGEDYSALSGSVTIPVGKSSVTVPITPIDDTVLEGTETVQVSVIDGKGYSAGAGGRAAVAIADNEMLTPEVNHWNAKFINRTAENAGDRNSYDFSNPAAVLDLGDQHQGRTDGGIRLSQDWGAGSPAASVQTDNFAMDAWTRTTLEAGKLYKITTRSDDGTWFTLRNVQTGNLIDNVVDGENGGYWNRGEFADRTIFFKVPESGEYDFHVLFYEMTSAAKVDVNLEEVKPFDTFPSGQEAANWKSNVFWWDRKSGKVPPADFSSDPNNLIGAISQGANVRSDGKPGIAFDFSKSYQPLNNDINFPDDNYAIRSSTQAYLEAGVKYRARVRGDDGFKLMAKLANTDEWVYITPKEQWQQAYGDPQQIEFTVPQSGTYDMYFDYYEERGNAYFDLSWESVPFTGKVIATIGAIVRSGPGTSYEKVGLLGFQTPLTFDKWTEGEFVDYTSELETSSSRWYRIAGTTDQWISAAIISGGP